MEWLGTEVMILEQNTDGYSHTGSQNAFLVKRKQSGGIQFSRDPFNLTNKHSQKYAGYLNHQV